MRTLGGLTLVLALVASLLATACYDPRIQSCRDPMTDFSSVSDVTITDAIFGASAGEGAVSPASYTITAHVSGVARTDCVAVHSELRDGTRVIETIDTPVRARTIGGVITTTPIFHYHAAGTAPTVHVVALGVTIDAPLVRAGSFPDAGIVRADVGP